MNMSETFSEYIKKVRKSKKFSLRKLSSLSGISNAYLSQLETGKRGLPSPEIIKNLAASLDVSYELLLEKAGYLNIDLKDELKDWNLYGQQLKEEGYSLTEIMELIKVNIKVFGK
jgi:transcriptional regulator with XRE-family HTH domain